MSLSNIQVPNTLDLFCGTLNGVTATSNSSAVVVCAISGCATAAGGVNMTCAQISGLPANMVALSLQWELGGALTASSVAVLIITGAIPAFYIPLNIKTCVCSILYNSVLTPMFCTLDNTGIITIKPTSGGFSINDTIQFNSIDLVYSTNN